MRSNAPSTRRFSSRVWGNRRRSVWRGDAPDKRKEQAMYVQDRVAISLPPRIMRKQFRLEPLERRCLLSSAVVGDNAEHGFSDASPYGPSEEHTQESNTS